MLERRSWRCWCAVGPIRDHAAAGLHHPTADCPSVYPGGFKRARDLNPEVHVHRQVAARGAVIEKHVVPIGAQARLGPQELPHLIERRPPRSSGAADSDMTPDGGKLGRVAAVPRVDLA